MIVYIAWLIDIYSIGIGCRIKSCICLFFFSVFWYIAFIRGPVLAMVLKKENAVADWRTLIGPTDARKAKITHPGRLFVFSFYFSWHVGSNIIICSHFVPCSIWFIVFDIFLHCLAFCLIFTWLLLLVFSASEQCVDWIQKKIVFMVRTLWNQLKEKSPFSLGIFRQVSSDSSFFSFYCFLLLFCAFTEEFWAEVF